jgi:hypothetical protein
MPRVTCEKCGVEVHRNSLPRHQKSKKCQNQTMMNMMGQMSGMIQSLDRKVEAIASRPQVVHNTINQYIIATKEPLSLIAIEASVAMGMQASVLRDGAQGIAQYVVI